MTRKMTYFPCILLFSVLLCVEAHAQTTIKAASCNESDVQTAINQATANGDIVSIPAGTCTWTTQIKISKGITIQGAGEGQTIIIDDTPKGNSTCQGVESAISGGAAAPALLRITNLTMQGGSPPQHICGGGMLNLYGSFRVDHVAIANIQSSGIQADGVQGLIDHCTFSGNSKQAIRASAWSYNGGDGYGDGSWAAPTDWGSSKFLFIEDNDFSGLTNEVGVGDIDEYNGARVVFRHNTGVDYFGVHGTETSGRERSARANEIYDNTFVASGSNEPFAIFLRGGTALIWGNSFNSNGSYFYKYSTALVQLINYRDMDKYAPWGVNGAVGACDGTSPFDVNDGVTYATGTFNGTSGTANVLTDTTKDWRTNQWVGYSIINLTQGWSSVIVSNTSTTITSEPSTRGRTWSWNSGDKYKILRATQCIDQVGVGQGDLLSGYTPINTVTGSQTPPNEKVDPVYLWDNRSNGTLQKIVWSRSPHIVVNKNVYQYDPAFNGASGTGQGTLANRPSTCTPSVGYWATDANNGNGELYVCTAVNTWTAYYKPYVYPNPRDNSGSATLNPPQDLTATTH